MAINYTTKYSPLIAERFKLQSFTDQYAGKKYDFDGAQSIIIYSVDKVELTDYNRLSANSRFGQVGELGDATQTLTMTQDKAFTFSIDHGHASDQFNIKHCNEQLKSNWDEVVTPAIDAYRLKTWANGAGLGAVGSALTKNTIVESIITGSAAMSNALIPKKNRAVFVSESAYIATKLSGDLAGIESVKKDAIINGVVGKLDGMDVIAVPDSYMPAGLVYMIKYKDATIDPLKLKTMRVQKNPPGIDGDVGECRFYHDSFVLDSRIGGIYIYSTTGVAIPQINISTNNVTLVCPTSGAQLFYTLDGSNPKSSDTATLYSSTFSIESGQTVRAFGKKVGLISSPVSTKVNA